MKPAANDNPLNGTWRDVAIVRCEVGTVEALGPGIPALRFVVQSGQQHAFCFSSIADLARLGETITRHAERLAAIAAAAARPN